MAVSDPVRPAAQMREVEAIGEIAGESQDGDSGGEWEEVRGGLQHMYYSALPGCAWWMITSVARQRLALEVHCLRNVEEGTGTHHCSAQSSIAPHHPHSNALQQMLAQAGIQFVKCLSTPTSRPA